MIYFASDIHLGAGTAEEAKRTERAFCRWLDMVSKDATEIYLLGDIFDFWFEHRRVAPKGFVRVLGRLAELTDRGVRVVFFAGNHDMWCRDYFEKECGVVLHRQACSVELHGKEFFLAHGDEFSKEGSFKVLRAIFHSRFLQRCFSAVHPRWALWMGHAWARHSMIKHKVEGDTPFLGVDNEFCVQFAKEYLVKHPQVDCFIFGHRHIDEDFPLGDSSRCIFLGDWISTFAYVVFDGKEIQRKYYVEGESKDL